MATTKKQAKSQAELLDRQSEHVKGLASDYYNGWVTPYHLIDQYAELMRMREEDCEGNEIMLDALKANGADELFKAMNKCLEPLAALVAEIALGETTDTIKEFVEDYDVRAKRDMDALVALMEAENS